MNPVDMWFAIRRRKAMGGGDGRCRYRDGRPVDLELYKFDACPYCQVAMRAVERLGIPVRYRDILEDEAAAEKLVEVGGEDQVPCLFIDGRPLYESRDIVAFLQKHIAPGSPAPETP
jgi:glutaredoxin 3